MKQKDQGISLAKKRDSVTCNATDTIIYPVKLKEHAQSPLLAKRSR